MQPVCSVCHKPIPREVNNCTHCGASTGRNGPCDHLPVRDRIWIQPQLFCGRCGKLLRDLSSKDPDIYYGSGKGANA